MSSDQVVQFMFGLSLVLVACWVLGRLAQLASQPAVIGELVAGILLGPSLFDGQLSSFLLRDEVRPALSAIADVGLALFMFVIGTELDRDRIRTNWRAVSGVSAGSLLVPFCSGVALGCVLHPGAVQFPIFLGTALAVTAFPVLARIVSDRALGGTRVGSIATASAAVGDAVAWIALAVIVAAGRPSLLLVLSLPYLVLMVTVVRRLLALLETTRISDSTRTTLYVLGVLASAGFTEMIGLHFVFGAFVFGVVMPNQSARVANGRTATERIGQIAFVFMPVYFVVSGFQVDLSLLDLSSLWLLGGVLISSVGGKMVGVYAAARLSKIDKRSATGLAILLNTRGLTEIVVLTVGLQTEIIDHRMYSILVVMALVTTSLTGPLLSLVYPRRDRARSNLSNAPVDPGDVRPPPPKGQTAILPVRQHLGR